MKFAEEIMEILAAFDTATGFGGTDEYAGPGVSPLFGIGARGCRRRPPVYYLTPARLTRLPTVVTLRRIGRGYEDGR